MLHRSVQTAVQVSLGGIGAIVGTVAYRAQDAPRFIPGISMMISKKLIFANFIAVRPICHARLSSSTSHNRLDNNRAFHAAKQDDARGQEN